MNTKQEYEENEMNQCIEDIQENIDSKVKPQAVKLGLRLQRIFDSHSENGKCDNILGLPIIRTNKEREYRILVLKPDDYPYGE